MTDAAATIAALLSKLEGFGVSERQVRDAMAGRSEADAAWKLMNEAAVRLMAEGEFHNLAMIYFKMAMQIDREGRDFTPFQRECKRAQLLSIKNTLRDSDKYTVLIRATSNSCPACLQLDGQRITLADAIRSQPLPRAECTNEGVSGRLGWCRCDYQVEIR